MRGPLLKGLMKVKKTLASGKTIYYCYAWRGGPPLKTNTGEPMQPGDALLAEAYAAARDRRKTPTTRDLNEIITRYRASSDFRATAPKTRREYDRYLDVIRGRFGLLTREQLQDPSTRGEFKEWRDSLADTPRSADFAWAVLVRVLSFAKDRGMLSVNIAERGGRLYRAARKERIWSDENIAAFEAVAPPHMRLALHLALWTGQRKGDLLRLTWRDYDGRSIKLRQSKTGTRVMIPVDPLVAELDAARSAGAILKNSRGQAWTSDGFDTSWRRICGSAGITALTFHDLRGTAVTRMALAGCTVPEIAAVTGHSLRDVEAMLDLHYLGGRAELAGNAMRKMMKRRGTSANIWSS